MAAIILRIINKAIVKINIIVKWLPPLISQHFHPGFLKATFLYSLAVFAWILLILNI